MYISLRPGRSTVLAVVACIILASLLAVMPLSLPGAAETEYVSVPIIMYHQISENRRLWGRYVIPAETLRGDFEHIKKLGYTTVTVSDIINHVNGIADLPEKPIVLSFDDGQRSMLTKVLPLLEEFGFCAVMSVVGSLCDMYTKNGDTSDSYAYLNLRDLKVLADSGRVELGNHTYNLHSLSKRKGIEKLKSESDEEYSAMLKEDILKNNQLIFDAAGKRPQVVAYPYGVHSDLAEQVLHEIGVTATLSCAQRVNRITKSSDCLYDLGRFNRPYGKSSDTFFELFKDPAASLPQSRFARQ